MVCICECRCSKRPEASNAPRAGVTDGSELPNTQVRALNVVPLQEQCTVLAAVIPPVITVLPQKEKGVKGSKSESSRCKPHLCGLDGCPCNLHLILRTLFK